MIKIFFEHSIFLHQKFGGISKYIIKLNEKLINYNIDTKIISAISINDYLNNSSANKRLILKLDSIPKFCRKFFFFLNDLYFLIYIFVSKPNLIHFTFYNNTLLKFLNVPYILTVYDLINERFNLQNDQFNKRNLIKSAKHIICISNFTKSELIKIYNVPKEKISVIYLGIDKKKIVTNINKKNFILFVGDRGRYKNFIKLIECFSLSNFLKKNYKVICFGNNKFNSIEQKILKKLNLTKNFVHEYGDDKKLQEYYRDANLFISLSLMEGFGLTPLEAMYFNCPVVCSDIPIFREILADSCEYIDPNDPKNLKEKIEKILKSQKEQNRLIKLGQQKISEYSWERCCYQTSEIYKKILNEK